jgi:hypothetical protein
MIRLDLSKTQGFKAHRSGWSYCMNTLKPLHSNSGIFVDDFIERNFAWNIKEYFKKNEHNLPYKRQWIGFLHNPPNVPEWFDFINSPQAVLNRGVFKKSLETCKALVTLSDYLKDWLQPQVPVPVISVKHPTEKPEHKWKPELFFCNKRKVVQLGYWLRKMFAICELRTGTKWQKYWLPSDENYSATLMAIEERTKLAFWETKYQWSAVKKMGHISNEDFDNMLSSCIIFLDLYDSSANNAIVEGIARNTPILVNRIPAVVEYLGEDYPFYFDNIEDAAYKLIDDSLIIQTYDYLSNMNKEWICGSYFAKDLHSKLENIL